MYIFFVLKAISCLSTKERRQELIHEASVTKYSKNLDLKVSLNATNQSHVIISSEKKSNHIGSLGALEKLFLFHIFCMATRHRFLKQMLKYFLLLSIPTYNHGLIKLLIGRFCNTATLVVSPLITIVISRLLEV